MRRGMLVQLLRKKMELTGFMLVLGRKGENIKVSASLFYFLFLQLSGLGKSVSNSCRKNIGKYGLGWRNDPA